MQGGAARLDWREIVNAKTLTLVADWFADLPDFQRARVRWAFADPIGRPNDPNLVSGSKYEALALRYTDLDRPVQRPKGGYGSAAHGLQALSADALASTAADEEWVPASSVEKKPLHELYTTKAHSESRIKPPEHGPYMRDWAERNLVSTTARFSLPHAPPLPLRVSFLMPGARALARAPSRAASAPAPARGGARAHAPALARYRVIGAARASREAIRLDPRAQRDRAPRALGGRRAGDAGAARRVCRGPVLHPRDDRPARRADDAAARVP